MKSEQTPSKGSTQFLNFSDALHHLRWGERIARRTWPPGHYLQVFYGCYEPYVEYHSLHDSVKWKFPATSILAEDWYVLGEHQ